MSSAICYGGWCTVARGTLIIGLLHIICGIASIIHNSIDLNIMMNYPDRTTDPKFQQDRIFRIRFDFVQIFMTGVHVILSCLMVHGYRKQNYRLIMPWLIWSSVSLTILATGITILLLTMVLGGQADDAGVILAISGSYFVIQAYFIVVVKKFVHELEGMTSY
ncbi:uncharacterized protein LOC118437108 [Folsomia candida]|uniref:Uncharacterized protein n=1 Tax=Folsomia candida TaxID=158441 RepID=A0A226DRS8_FOLCA|nr:uncharacterized protein LOC118437108 [Folsomia candida]OXA47770.1 hypothetical protein Fcan01_17234 [Folsomia candida]